MHHSRMVHRAPVQPKNPMISTGTRSAPQGGIMGTLSILGSDAPRSMADHAAPEVAVIEGPGVHIEADAVSQLRRIAGLPGCVRAVGMPDLHPGPGIPIGMATASTSHVHPTLV